MSFKHEWPDAIDFTSFMDHVEAKYGFNYRDMANSRSPEAYAERDAARDKWVVDNGFDGYQHVVNAPEGAKVGEDWAPDSVEMAMRIKINNGWWKSPEKEAVERPYQDVWHWLLDNDFCDLNRGGANYMTLDDERLADPEIPQYVLTVLKAIRAEVEGNPAFDGEMVCFHVDW